MDEPVDLPPEVNLNRCDSGDAVSEFCLLSVSSFDAVVVRKSSLVMLLSQLLGPVRPHVGSSLAAMNRQVDSVQHSSKNLAQVSPAVC
jgi:hypothetical protein